MKILIFSRVLKVHFTCGLARKLVLHIHVSQVFVGLNIPSYFVFTILGGFKISQTQRSLKQDR